MLSLVAFGCVAASAPALPADDIAAIRDAMGSPGSERSSPVEVGPLVIVGNHAIAGWAEGDRGGRALLSNSGGQWRIVLCGGDALKRAATLEEAGISGRIADALTARLNDAESALPADRRARLASFVGVVPVSTASGRAGCS